MTGRGGPTRREVPIREYVTKKLIAVAAESSIQEAAKRMVEFDISSVVVADGEKVVGFLTDADLKARVVAAGRNTDGPVSAIMTTDLITASIDASVEEVMELMARHRIKHVLVTEGEAITGIMTLRDLVNIERQKLETFIARE
jgi:signal-transduction protein with cAMP-binding, CBS, and nucleotidyltransferase domain